jgi:hypothetical protein
MSRTMQRPCGAAQQADEADIGGLEVGRSMVGDLLRGWLAIENQGAKSRPSQLICGVGHLKKNGTFKTQA